MCAVRAVCYLLGLFMCLSCLLNHLHALFYPLSVLSICSVVSSASYSHSLRTVHCLSTKIFRTVLISCMFRFCCACRIYRAFCIWYGFCIWYSCCICYCSGHRAIVQRVPDNLLNVQLCSYVPDKGSRWRTGRCSARSCVDLCGVESCALPPPPQPFSPPCPSHFMLSLLATLQRDGSEWSTQLCNILYFPQFLLLLYFCISCICYFCYDFGAYCACCIFCAYCVWCACCLCCDYCICSDSCIYSANCLLCLLYLLWLLYLLFAITVEGGPRK
jgi:hypothetical protein